MRDRTAEIRAIVMQYEGFEFIPLRIEDAFDNAWWESTGGRPVNLDVGVDMTHEGFAVCYSCEKLCLINDSQTFSSHLRRGYQGIVALLRICVHMLLPCLLKRRSPVPSII